MSSENKKGLFIGIAIGILGIAGISTIIYIFRSKKVKKQKKIEAIQDTKIVSEAYSLGKDVNNDSNNNKSKLLQITPNVQIELIHKVQTRESNDKEDKKQEPKEYKEDEEQKYLFSSQRVIPTKRELTKRSTKEKLNSSINKNRYDSDHSISTPIKPPIFNTNNYDFTLLNLNDFKEQIKKSQAFKDLNVDLSISLDRPILATDIQKIAGLDKIFDSDGYVEEDDDEDIRENLDSSFFKRDENSFSTERRHSQKDVKLAPPRNSEKIIISSAEELHEILYGKNGNEELSYCLTYDEREFEIQRNKMENITIIKANILLIILKYLHSELHPGLIELSDNFVEERRKYFQVDNETYISIIQYFLKKKEEFFLCVLSDLMSKLGISQTVLDNTFFYFMNVADPTEDENVSKIREAYDRVYHAGIK